MPKPKQKCEFCGQFFKRVRGHYSSCKSRQENLKRLEHNTAVSTYTQGKEQRFTDAKNDQRFRGNDALIILTESVAKLNLALAQVIGEAGYIR